MSWLNNDKITLCRSILLSRSALSIFIHNGYVFPLNTFIANTSHCPMKINRNIMEYGSMLIDIGHIKLRTSTTY